MQSTVTNTDQANEAASWWLELERLSRALGQVGPDEVCCEGLTPRQTGILRTLVQREGARLSDLAAEACVTPGAMTRLLGRLEAQGLVQRVRGTQTDGRAASVRITARGRQTRKRIDALMLDRASTIIAAVPLEERETVLNALRRFNDALQSAGCCVFNAPQSLVNISAGKEK